MKINIIKSRLSILQPIKPYLQGSNRLIIVLLVIKTLFILTGLVGPYLFKMLVDDVIISHNFNLIIWICLGYISIFLFETLIHSTQMFVNNRLFNRILFNVKYALFNKSIHAPMTFHETYDSADLKIRIDADADKFENLVKEYFVDYTHVWLHSIFLLAMLLYLDWKLALISFITIPLSFWLTKYFGGLIGKTQEEYRNKYGHYEEWLKENLQSWRDIKIFSIEKRELRLFTRIWHALSNVFFKQEILVISYECILVLKDFFLSKMALYLVGGIVIFFGDLTIGTFLIFLIYFDQFMGNVRKINTYDMQLNMSVPSINRVIEILEYPLPKLAFKEKGVIRGNIEFKNVFFKYQSSPQNVLEDISFKINANEKVTIVGKSGCGKTTIIKLLLNLYSKDQGQILIDNRNIEDINPKALYDNIGVVMQDNILFNMSIKDNLLFANPKATDIEIQNACKEAYIDTFINELPDKYDTMIGEKGLRLSGGQRQRIAIARAFIKNPSIVIFDEATSSLDHESEKAIYTNMENIFKNKTVIIIAHKFSSILKADKIIVMSEGKICGFGRHDDLVTNNDCYKNLFKSYYKELV